MSPPPETLARIFTDLYNFQMLGLAGIVAEGEARTTSIDHLAAELDCQITRSNRLRHSVLSSAFAGRLSA